MAEWQLSSSSDSRSLAVVDGFGPWTGMGPHYSRRTPGSRTFTGVGQEVVLFHPAGAVWAVVRQRVPAPRGTGQSRGRTGETHQGQYVWRNMMFRNLSSIRASDLIRSAVQLTVTHWVDRYGSLPDETLRTEVNAAEIASDIPGYCYRRAGWKHYKTRGRMIYLRCPRSQIVAAACIAPQHHDSLPYP